MLIFCWIIVSCLAIDYLSLFIPSSDIRSIDTSNCFFIFGLVIRRILLGNIVSDWNQMQAPLSYGQLFYRQLSKGMKDHIEYPGSSEPWLIHLQWRDYFMELCHISTSFAHRAMSLTSMFRDAFTTRYKLFDL